MGALAKRTRSSEARRNRPVVIAAGAMVPSSLNDTPVLAQRREAGCSATTTNWHSRAVNRHHQPDVAWKPRFLVNSNEPGLLAGAWDCIYELESAHESRQGALI